MLGLVAHVRRLYPNQFYAFELKLSAELDKIRPVRALLVPAQVSIGPGPADVYPVWEQVNSHLWTSYL